MQSRRGQWTIDEAHNGHNNSDTYLLMFRPDVDDATRGFFVAVSGSQVGAGRFKDAVPHIGEADFRLTTRLRTIGKHLAIVGRMCSRLPKSPPNCL